MHKPISGVHAAVSTPRLADGTLDENSLRNILRFLLESGIRGFALNGATAEYCVVSPAELLRILEIAQEMFAGKAEFVCGIGSAGTHGCLSSGHAAIAAGAKALLLPTPHFFAYQQSDLYAFCSEVASRLPISILLYNLPQFTTGLESATVVRLIADCPNIVGIKDSSGSLDILRALQASGMDSCRIVGNDSVLADALKYRLCDGVISGVACALPELILGLYEYGGAPDSAEFLRYEEALKKFIAQLSDFPVPWGLKWIAESRGIAPASFAQPVSATRLDQARELQAWFREWYAGALQEAVNT